MSSLVNSEQLQQVALFANLEPPLLAQLAAHSVVQQYAADEVVFHEADELPDCLHILVSGRLRIARVTTLGKETILRILLAGEVFAAPALFGNGRAPATVTAIEPAAVIMVEKQALLTGFSQNPQLALQILVALNQRLQQLHNRIHGLVSERAIVRLIHYLEQVAAEGGTEVVADGERLRSRLTHYQLARSIGITYEECVRLFKQLQPAVTYQRGGIITILDRHKLAIMSH